MKLNEIYRQNKLIKSFEIFPPKADYDILNLYNTIEDLKLLNPDFVSVTYGAGGGTRNKTVEIASYIKNKIGIETVAHLTCVNSSKDDIANVLISLKENNIKNILALRGDPPLGTTNITESLGGFKYAYQLIEFIKSQGDWSIAVAGYPEGHNESKSFEENIEYLKLKVDRGADLIISQLFFNNEDFYRFRDEAVKKGINIPIIPGIFPILNFNAIKKIASLCGAKIPHDLLNKLENSKDSAVETEKIGIEYATKQTADLIKNGVKGIHFYSMNKSRQIKLIFDNIFIK
jgi:methylenetetrahydrofolate reductase (NADPH)